jgi:hypothetical protein
MLCVEDCGIKQRLELLNSKIDRLFLFGNPCKLNAVGGGLLHSGRFCEKNSANPRDLNLDSLLSRARSMAGGELTPEERKFYMLCDSSTSNQSGNSYHADHT